MNFREIRGSSFRFVGLFLLVAAGLLSGSGCQRKKEPPFAAADYETPAAEAVLHRLLKDEAEARKDAKVGVIVLGEQMKDSTPAFRERFPEAALQWFSTQSLATVWVGPIARVVEKSTQLQPFQLQVFSVTSSPDGTQEIIAAWAFEDRMLRRRYRATPAPNGHWNVQPLDVIEQKGASAP
jgi:hypothetical protein